MSEKDIVSVTQPASALAGCYLEDRLSPLTQLHRSHHIRYYAHVVHDALRHVMNVGCTVYVTQLYIDILFDTTPYPLLPHAHSPFHVSTLHGNTTVPDINILRIHDK